MLLKGVCLLHLLSENIFPVLRSLILCFDETKMDLKPLIVILAYSVFTLPVMMAELLSGKVIQLGARDINKL